MTIDKKNNILFEDVSTLKGVGVKLKKYLKNKKIEKINDLLWNLPYSFTDRSNIVSLDQLEIGKIQTIKVKVVKYNFPRKRKLPNTVNCTDENNKIDLTYFNSREGYLRKILPINNWVYVSGKINIYKKKYQITNPDYVTTLDNINYVKKIIPKYSLTEGLTEKSYRKIIEQVLEKIPKIDEWLETEFVQKMNFLDWRESILKLHQEEFKKDVASNFYRRLAYDEILAHLISLSKNRLRIKKIKKNNKIFDNKISNKILKSLNFQLTNSQVNVIKEINDDIKSSNRMFRILQGDVGSGKTIVSLISAANVIEAKYQSAIMAPTEILATQHFNLAKEIFKKTNVTIDYLSGKTEYREKKRINEELMSGKIDLVIGTHSLFQKKIKFNKLGLIIIDEQHKFGVKQRIDLAKKGGDECDVLLMSATPIPRTMIMSIYGDMDISKITEKPAKRKPITTLSKPEKKLNELWGFIRKQIKDKNQIFWVCPLIEESKFLNYSSAIKRFDLLNKKFPNKVGLIHGALDKTEKENILKKFLNRKIDLLVSTTVIEVGVDFPNANLIVIENSDKFGLAQLHQLRGRVGRGNKKGVCLLLFKETLSKNAVKRLKILKDTDDGFIIAEEDMRLRGYGDIIGFQQSGIKYFRIADPVHHEDLFRIAEKNVKFLENSLINSGKYDLLLKLFDRAEITNEKIIAN
jgi:ATP-dependent DNA helicase RecG